MADIGKSIRTYLATKSGVTDLIGSSPMRYYPERKPHTASGPPTYPLCTHSFSATPSRHLTGDTGHESASVTIECFAATKDAVEGLAKAIKTELHAKGPLTMGDHFVTDCTLISMVPTHEDNTDGSAFNTNYVRILDFLVDYTGV